MYATTPDNLARYMSIDNFTCGYGFRFIFVNPNYKHDRKNLEVETSEDSEAWGKILVRIKKLAYYFDNLKADILFKVQPEAMTYYNKVVHELEDKVDELNNDMLNSALGRGQAHILKTAMLLELGKKEVSTTITIESVEIAANMVIDYFIPSMMDMIDRLQEDIKTNKIEKIIAVLRRLGGVATHTEVLRNSKLIGKEFNECVITMYESGTIDIKIDKATKAKIYRLIDSNKPVHRTHRTHQTHQYTQDIKHEVNLVSLNNITEYIENKPAIDTDIYTYTTRNENVSVLGNSVSSVSSVSSQDKSVTGLDKPIPQIEVMDKIRRFGNDWQRGHATSINSRNLKDFVLAYCASLGDHPDEIEHLAGIQYKITPEPKVFPENEIYEQNGKQYINVFGEVSEVIIE